MIGNRIAEAARVAAAVLGAHLLLLAVLLIDSRWDPTVLLCIGEETPLPPGVPEPVRFAGRFGYDGQYYALVALDPLDRSGVSRLLDDPGKRFGRILLPALARLAGASDLRAVAVCFAAANLLASALVALLVLEAASRRGPTGTLFSLSLPTLAALSAGAQTGFAVATARGVPGPTGMALVLLGLLLRSRGRPLLAAVLFGLSALDHEVFAAVPVALALEGVLRRRPRELGWLLSLLPLVSWRAFLHVRGFVGAASLGDLGWPLLAAFGSGADALRFRGFAPEDLYALLHLASFLFLPLAARGAGSPAAPTIALWLAAALADRDVWISFWSFARATAPAFALVAAGGTRPGIIPALAAASFTAFLPVWFALFPPELVLP